MKSTKNYLKIGLVLTVGLFSSIQLFSMEQSNNITDLTTRIERLEFNLNSVLDSVSKIEDQIQQKLVVKLKNTFINTDRFINDFNAIAEEMNQAGKILNVLCSIIVETGMLTLQELQQRIHYSTDKAVGLKIIAQ